jgi:glycosyltransferase involved in cell wall biosynthesis
MRVLHLDDATGRRGGQVQLDLLRDQPGHRLATPRPEGDLPCTPGALHRAVREVDLLAAHTARAHQLALAFTGRVPVVVHRRVDFRIRRRARWKYRAAEAIVAVSHGVRDVVVQAGVHPDRVFVVPDAVVVGQDDGAAPGVDVLAVGALVPHKGHAVLIDACRARGLSLAIAGEGPLAGELRERARGADVRFLGQRADVGSWMRSARVFAHPSLEEGMGQVVLEARARGCRIVASAVGGIPEAAGPHATLVRAGDADALGAALARVLDGPEPAPELPTQHRRAHLVARTLAVYATVLEGWRRPS